MEYDVIVRMQTVHKFKGLDVHHTKRTALLLRLCAVISAYILHYHY